MSIKVSVLGKSEEWEGTDFCLFVCLFFWVGERFQNIIVPKELDFVMSDLWDILMSVCVWGGGGKEQ